MVAHAKMLLGHPVGGHQYATDLMLLKLSPIFSVKGLVPTDKGPPSPVLNVSQQRDQHHTLRLAQWPGGGTPPH